MFRNETEFYLFLVAVAVVAVAVWTTNRRKNRKKLEQLVNESFGTVPVIDDKDISYLKSYHQDVVDSGDHLNDIDEITWNDLNMDDVFRRLNRCSSSTGEEYLYHILHRLVTDPSLLDTREQRVRWMIENDADRKWLQTVLMGIGIQKNNGLSLYIHGAEKKKLPHDRLYAVMAFLPLLAALTFFVNPALVVFAMSATVGVNIFIYTRVRLQIEAEMESMQYFSRLVYGAKRIRARFGDKLAALDLDLQSALQPFQRSQGWLSSGAQSVAIELQSITVILNAVFLVDLIRYNRMVDRMQKNAVQLHEVYRTIGELEAAISIASFRKSLPEYCLPAFHKKNEVEFHNMIHPLLKEPVANSGHIDNDSIITGSNASGKSTFIKTIAINHIFAQTIHTCCAEEYRMRPSYVASSMALKDDILSGESYFITEIKSLKRIIEYCKTRPCICFIDEILRGTNTTERIAASTAVLHVLHETDSLCIIASHDIELTKILADEYDNFHFSENFQGGEIDFDYKLKDGPSKTTNAIKLLEHMGFDSRIVQEATALATERKENAQ